MSATNYFDLMYHYGHEITIAHYSNKVNPDGVSASIECETCSEVLLDYDKEVSA